MEGKGKKKEHLGLVSHWPRCAQQLIWLERWYYCQLLLVLTNSGPTLAFLTLNEDVPII